MRVFFVKQAAPAPADATCGGVCRRGIGALCGRASPIRGPVSRTRIGVGLTGLLVYLRGNGARLLAATSLFEGSEVPRHRQT
jgi:hypothetical protein